MADVFEIPIDYDGSVFYEQTTKLDGEDFRLIFDYNSDDGFWYLSVRTVDDVVIEGCEGVRLVKGGWPLRRVRSLLKPAGQLVVTTEIDNEPGLEDLGSNTFLIYVPADALGDFLI